MYVIYRRFFFRISIICCLSTILKQSSVCSCNQHLEMDKKSGKIRRWWQTGDLCHLEMSDHFFFNFNINCNDWMYLERKKFLKIMFCSSFIRKWKFAFLPCVPYGFIVFGWYTLKMAWYIISSREGEWQLIWLRMEMY